MSVHTLYLCYFGLREPLVQTQVLPYLRELRKGDISVHLLTFEPGWPESWPETERQTWQERLTADGIEWRALRYHQQPSLPATLWDIAVGAWMVLRWARRDKIGVLHARSHVAATIGAIAKPWCGAKLIFDIRGLMAEEYVDGGLWSPDGLLFRLTKAVERWLLNTADGFVVLTERLREILFTGRAAIVEVIPCCVDGLRYRRAETVARDAVRQELGITDERVFVYVGALGGWNMTDKMAELLALAYRQEPRTFALILSHSSPHQLSMRLKELGIPPCQFLIHSVKPDEIPVYLKAADVALSFTKPSYSKVSASPTKISECLAAGLPVLSTAGIGDFDSLLTTESVGVILQGFNEGAYKEALRAISELRRDSDLSSRCRAVALRSFDLANVGGVRYRRLYERVMNPE